LPLYESWGPAVRECALLLDDKVTLEEILSGVDHVLRGRSRAWLRARRRFGPVIAAPVRLLELRRTRLVLALDPLLPFATRGRQIKRLLTEWNVTRTTNTARFRRTRGRVVRALEEISRSLKQDGRVPTTKELAKLLRCSEPKARRAHRDAVRLAPEEFKAIFERHRRECDQCKTGVLCATESAAVNRLYQFRSVPTERAGRAVGRVTMSVEEAEEIKERTSWRGEQLRKPPPPRKSSA